MLRNYLIVALRSFHRNRVYTAINVTGLAVGMTAFLLVGLYVSDELSYDDFHADSDRIMAVVVEMKGSFPKKWQSTPRPLADALKASLPEVQQVVRTRGSATEATVRRTSGGDFERSQQILIASSTFFEVFSFPLLKGDPDAVLNAPQQAVVTERMAHAFFGEENPVGQTLTFELRGQTRTITVAGVAETPPANSTIKFDMVVPAMSNPPTGQAGWNTSRWHTYALLDESSSADAFSEKVRQVVASHVGRNRTFTYAALPLPELYLSDYYEAPGFSGQRRYVYLFGAIGLLILLIAAINYVNLATAQGKGRAKEVGVRRTMGAQREQLATQFLCETALLSGVSLVLAFVLTGLALPSFSSFLSVDLSLSSALGGRSLLQVVVFVLLVSLGACAYPALVLSRFRPAEVLRGRSGTGGAGRSWLRRGLVVFQFAVSVGLILCTIVILRQLHFVQTRSLGFDGEQVVSIELPMSVDEQRRQTIKREVMQVPGVESATASGSVPGGFNVSTAAVPGDISGAARTTGEESLDFRPSEVDADYIETMGMEVLAGRGFRQDRLSDRTRGYVLNRAAARAMGWTPQEAVGKPFLFERGPEAPPGEVLGVVENFHIESLRTPVKPVVLLMDSPMFSSSPTLSARLAPGQVGAAMGGIEEVMAAHFPQNTFDYTFLGEKFDAMYRSETRLAKVFAVFAGIAILVACLGLFGLAAFAAERRSKEIAIRKVMGASVRDIATLISKELITLVAAAVLIGVPVAWWGIEGWLTGFAYRVEVGAGTFVLTASAALLVAGIATNYHALRAALADPTQALRDE